MCEYYDEDGKTNPRLLSQTQAAVSSVAFVDRAMTEYMARRRCDEMARLPRREFEKK
jgi:hypothetical protein